MSTTFILVIVALSLLMLFAYLAIRRNSIPRDVDQAFGAIRALDVEAFRNLVSPEEENFLRARLAPREFRKIRRQRALAARAYVRALSDAALQFARLGGAAQRSSDPAIVASGKEIANSATYLRFCALQASISLTMSAAFPGLGPRPLRSLLDQYDRATHLLQNHSGLERARSQP